MPEKNRQYDHANPPNPFEGYAVPLVSVAELFQFLGGRESSRYSVDLSYTVTDTETGAKIELSAVLAPKMLSEPN